MTKPWKSIRAGQVSCAIWQNEANANGKVVPMLKCTVERRYKDKDDTWKSSGSFARNEIPLAIYCLQQAFEAMIDKDSDMAPIIEEEVSE